MKLKLEIEIEDGKVVSVKTVDPNVKNVEPFSEYARYFDEGCTGWTKDAEYNLLFLRKVEIEATDILRSRGYIFLNEVYDMLGFPRSKAGQLVGWVYDIDGDSDNCVDFGLYNKNPKTADFVNGYARTVWLDFNVDGDITKVLKDGEA